MATQDDPSAGPMGRPRLSASGPHERINISLPPDVLEYLAGLGPTRSGAIRTLVRQHRAARPTRKPPTRLFKAARLVVARWDGGDLAAAVRELAAAVAEVSS